MSAMSLCHLWLKLMIAFRTTWVASPGFSFSVMYEVRSLVADILQIGVYPTIPIKNPYIYTHIFTVLYLPSLIRIFTIFTYIISTVYMYIEELGQGKIILSFVCQVALPHFSPSVSPTLSCKILETFGKIECNINWTLNVSQLTAGGGYIKMPMRWVHHNS